MDRKSHAIETAKKIAADYPAAKAVLLAGSVLRGEDTPSSDLDIVVVFEHLARAKRVSFLREGWPVEVFVHDRETLRYFIEVVDTEPVLSTMIAESYCVGGEAPFAKALQDEMAALLAKGPPPWSTEALERARYAITDSLDDLRHPRSPAELIASGVSLYDQMAAFFFRSRQKWCARKKMIPRKICEFDPDFGSAFIKAFEGLFSSGNTAAVFELAESLLKPYGGLLFEGYTSEAPPSARKPQG